MSRAITIENLLFSYPDGTEALKGVTFEVSEGASVGLIGSNGSGKTTLLLHLNGILCGTGRIEIFSKAVSQENLSAIRSEVGLVFQDPDSQLFMPTVYDDVAFGPLNMGLPAQEIDRRVHRALACVDMKGASDKISHHLSLGEKKRVAFATVLAMDPRVLVLDEPTSNLDPRHRVELMGILRDIKVTKLIASHDLDMILALTDEVILLGDGVVAARGPTRDILSDKSLLSRYGFCFFP